MAKRFRLYIFIGLEALAVFIIFLLILFAGRKNYTVTFDVNGGEVISGEVEQSVRRGGTATPPNVAREGCYLLKWAGQYSKVTGDTHVVAVWEYDTTAGLEYETNEDQNYCILSNCYKELSGAVYSGSYYNGKQVLGIKADAFSGAKYIESLFFLDGILSIGDGAFSGCSSLSSVTLPPTLLTIGEGAFENCVSLESLTLPEHLREIRKGAFVGCEGLLEIVIPESVEVIQSGAFTVEGMKIILPYEDESELPEGFAEDFFAEGVEIVYAPAAEDVTSSDSGTGEKE